MIKSCLTRGQSCLRKNRICLRRSGWACQAQVHPSRRDQARRGANAKMRVGATEAWLVPPKIPPPQPSRATKVTILIRSQKRLWLCRSVRMRSDIDNLMEEAGHDFLMVRGTSGSNPSMVYFTGIANMTHATLLKKRGETPVLIHNAMERDEAAKSGCRLKNIDDFGWIKLIEAAGGDTIEATSQLLRLAFDEFNVQGQVAIYGRLEIGDAYSLMKRIEEVMPQVHFLGEARDTSVLSRARTTKDTEEVERIRHMGRITTDVVSEVAGFLTSQRVKGEMLIDGEGQPVTIGAVRRLIDLQLARLGAANPDATIFAMGHDSAVPHSIGRDSEALRVGQPIIFDIFPCEPGGGYYYDFTRTWCLGHAPDEVQQLYQDVLDIYNPLLKDLHGGIACREFQNMAC